MLPEMRDLRSGEYKVIDVIEIFCSYSHKDEKLKSELEKHLSGMVRQGMITIWSDKKIDLGTEGDQEISKHLESAEVILLLVSSDFIASDYCYKIEMMRALQRHKMGKARTVPIILREVDYEEMPFSGLQALPTGRKAITSWDDRDKAFTDVARGIRKVVKQLRYDKLERASHSMCYWELTLKGTVDEINQSKVETILSSLRAYGDTQLQFRRIETGSIICVFAGSKKEFGIIESKINSRELVQVGSFAILGIKEVTHEEILKTIEKVSIDKKELTTIEDSNRSRDSRDLEQSPKNKLTKWGIEELLKEVSIGVFPIFGKIPAGNPYPIPQLVTGYIEMDRFVINGKLYQIVGDQHDKFRLGFSLQVTYIAFRVTGDSMNKADLDDGDYVILRVSAINETYLVPSNGDIVAVALPETDAVTLKRFRRKGDQVVFEPDSTNPNHVSYPFKTSSVSSPPFKIVGIHVATLKPL